MNQLKNIGIALVLIVAAGGIFSLAPESNLFLGEPEQIALHETTIIKTHAQPIITEEQTIIIDNTPSPKPEQKPIATTIESPTSMVDLSVPFHSQAPLGNWGDPVQANACEEASLLMASWYFYNQELTAKEAIDEIHRLSNLALDLFNEFRDESTRDTMRLGKTAFPDLSFKLVKNPTITDIKQELNNGNLVLIPADGTVLKNPYYKPPGPKWHKIVIRGYNDKRNVFITNDPGTKRGDGLEYSYDNLMEAIGDYDTGFHVPLPLNREKLAIIVGK